MLAGFFLANVTTHAVAICYQLLQGVAMCSILSPLTEFLLPKIAGNKSAQQSENNYK